MGTFLAIAQSVTKLVSEVGCCDRGDSRDMVHIKQRITALDSKDLIAGGGSGLKTKAKLDSCWTYSYQNG